MEDGGSEAIGTIAVVAGFLILAYFIWQHYQVAAAPVQVQPAPAPGIYPPISTPPTLENVAIASIPVIGPLADFTVIKAGNAIMQNQFLEANSSVGPNKGQTEASAGALGLTVKQGGWSYSQVGSGIKKAVEFWKW